MFAAARAVLDRRLARDVDWPVLVACSGGGDSIALLLMARAWAAEAGRTLIVVTVDHGLQPQSADWAGAVARRCAAAGETHLTLRWEGQRPTRGVSAAAREARHRLLAQAAREAGARVVLVGHTADDVLEARLMRMSGSTVPSPREWSPSPAWPEGRGVFLLRPLLSLGRREIRQALAGLGESWIEDPANDNPLSLRARVRRAIAEGVTAAPESELPDPGRTPFDAGAGGELVALRSALAQAPLAVSRAWLGAALVCAAGGRRPPRGPALDRLQGLVRNGEDVAATLAGARIACENGHVIIAREGADTRAGRPPVLALPPGVSVVWDGRFEVVAHEPDLKIRPLAGAMSRLAPADRQTVLEAHPLARPAMPLVERSNGSVFLPGPGADVEAQPLIMSRLKAASGVIDHETAIVAWRTRPQQPKFAA
ncbi:MAG TPA: tRNA lysidine(34) synthetase TilS [Caulobacteraceae bacterium]|jgi:tRNA(Ile)-lysidine synthase